MPKKTTRAKQPGVIKLIRKFLISLVLVLAFTHSAYAQVNTIEVSSNAFIYSNDEMLNFHVAEYLANNYNDLVPFSETLTHWSGRSSVSPKILITLVVMQNSSDGNYTGVNDTTPFGALSERNRICRTNRRRLNEAFNRRFYTTTSTGCPTGRNCH